MNIRDKVRVERNEEKYPPRGTWPKYRGCIGTVVDINVDPRDGLTEYGLAFGSGARAEAWFREHELLPLPTP